MRSRRASGVRHGVDGTLRRRAGSVLRRLWAAPTTAVGLLPVLAVLAAGGRARWTAGALEVVYREELAACGRRARALPFRAIVFGHVILAVTREELQRLGPHERVHVAQCERWGPLFLPAYACAGAWQWLCGRDAYWDNPFEVEARALGQCAAAGEDG